MDAISVRKGAAMEVDCTLDNVTYLGEWSDWAFVCECLEADRVGDELAVRSLPARGVVGGAMRHQQAWLVDGALLSNMVELSSLGRAWVAADLGGRCRGRIELNPNKVTDRVLELVRGFRVDHVTRADVALDYEGVGVTDFIFQRDRVKTTMFRRPSGVEGFMLGGRTSERFVRIYDKALELGRDDLVLTRVEGVGKHRRVLEDGLFEGVRALSSVISADLSLRRAGMVSLALHHPEVLSGHDKRTRGKYERLAESVQFPLSPSPDEVYRERRAALLDDVEAVSAGDRVRVARVYQ